MFCQSCGSALPPGGRSCPKCGSPVTAAAAGDAPPAGAAGSPFFAPSAGNAYSPAPMPPPKGGGSISWIIFGVVGCFGVIVVVGILAALLLPALAAARLSSRKTDCKNSLKQISVYFALYESKFKAYPPDLKSLWRPDLATDPKLFMCAVQGKGEANKLTPGARWESFSSLVAYEYRCPVLGDETPPDQIIAWDRTPHPNGMRNVMFFQGRVDELDQATFERLMSRK